jgi:hypothetical protein
VAWLAPVQSAQGSGTGTATATFTSTPTQNHVILISVYNGTNGMAPTTVTDGNLNAATLVLSHSYDAAARALSQWVLIAGADQSKSIIATLTSDTLLINIAELPGGSASSDVAAAGTSISSAATTSGSQPSVGPTTNAGDLIWTTIAAASAVSTVFAVDTGSGGGTAPSVIQDNPSTAALLADAYAIETSTGTYNPYWTWTTNRASGQITSALKPSAGSYSGGLLLGTD